jgi:ABC-2 type transport system permease protein
VSSTLLLAVFLIAAGEGVTMAPGVTVGTFVAPGVVLFAVSYAAFESSAVLILEDKIGETISEILMAPLGPLELVAGLVLAPLANALVAGGAVFVATLPFVDYNFSNPALALAFAGANALIFTLVGALIGLWADKWEHYGAADAFVMLPLGFLSGGFFALSGLPEAARIAVLCNPIYHAVNGMRAGLTGQVETPLVWGAFYLAGLGAALSLLLWWLIARGYKVRA